MFVIHTNTVQQSELFTFAIFSKKQSIGININTYIFFGNIFRSDLI